MHEIKSIKNIILGGEMFPNKCQTIKDLIKIGVRIFNIYGNNLLSYI